MNKIFVLPLLLLAACGDDEPKVEKPSVIRERAERSCANKWSYQLAESSIDTFSIRRNLPMSSRRDDGSYKVTIRGIWYDWNNEPINFAMSCVIKDYKMVSTKWLGVDPKEVKAKRDKMYEEAFKKERERRKEEERRKENAS